MEPVANTIADDALTRKWFRRSVVILMAVVSVYAGATLWIGRGGWELAFAAISVRDILTVVGLVLIGFILRVGRWRYYIRVLHWDVPLLPSLIAFVASIAFTATPAKSGELAKALLLRSRYKISLSQGAGVLLIERLGDLFAVVVLAIGGLTLFIDLSSYVLTSVILIGGVVFLAAISRVVLGHAQAIPRLRALSLKMINMLDAVQQLLRPMPLAIGGSVAVVAWSCEALAFHFLIGRLNIHSSILISFSIYGLSTLAGALSMLPGGLGSFEAVMAFLLTRLAVPASAATIAVAIFRLCAFWLLNLIGVIFMFAWITLFAKRHRPNLTVEVR
jgi:uncharacterized protein (TIRG00374 family)